MIGRLMIIVGWVLLVIGAGAVLIGTYGVAVSEGIWAAIQLVSPYNIANFVLTLLALSPGIALITWGKKLRVKSTKQTEQE